MFASIIVMAILISADALFIGMSLGMQSNFKFKFLIIISGVIFTFCLISYFITGFLTEYVHFDISIIAGILFILIGLKNLFSKNDDKLGTLSWHEVFLIGVVMSVDCVVATVALTVEYSKVIFVPIAIVVCHFVVLLVGSILTKYIKIPPKIRNIVSGFCLILVGVLNLI